MTKRPLLFGTREDGFTLVELMVVLIIMGILVTIVVLTMTLAREKAHQSACKANLRTLFDAIVTYQSEHDGVFPEELDDLSEEGSRYIKESFSWTCPSGDLNGTSGDYRDHYDNETGTVTCPRADHNP